MMAMSVSEGEVGGWPGQLLCSSTSTPLHRGAVSASIGAGSARSMSWGCPELGLGCCVRAGDSRQPRFSCSRRRRSPRETVACLCVPARGTRMTRRTGVDLVFSKGGPSRCGGLRPGSGSSGDSLSSSTQRLGGRLVRGKGLTLPVQGEGGGRLVADCGRGGLGYGPPAGRPWSGLAGWAGEASDNARGQDRLRQGLRMG